MTRPLSRLARGSAGVAAPVALAIVAAGCGGSSHADAKKPAAKKALTPAEIACTADSRNAMASTLAVPAPSIAESASMGNNGMPQCSFRAQLRHKHHVSVLLNVDNGPQPYFRLERTDVEDSQGFPQIDHAPPSSVTHLGLEADWFPQYPQLMATDGYRLITTAVTWGHEPQSRDRALAEAMTRPFMHPPHGKHAIAVAEGFPSSG